MNEGRVTERRKDLPFCATLFLYTRAVLPSVRKTDFPSVPQRKVRSSSCHHLHGGRRRAGGRRTVNGISLVRLDDGIFDVLVDGSFFGAHEAGSAVYALLL